MITSILLTSLTVLCFFIVFIMLTMAMSWLAQFSQTNYFDEFIDTPDQTDTEFLADIPAEIPANVAMKVRRAIALSAGLEVDEIWPETTMAELQETCTHMIETH